MSRLTGVIFKTSCDFLDNCVRIASLVVLIQLGISARCDAHGILNACWNGLTALFSESEFSAPKSEIPGIPDSDLALFRRLELGASVEVQVGDATVVGVVTDVQFSQLEISTEQGTKVIPYANIIELTPRPELALDFLFNPRIRATIDGKRNALENRRRYVEFQRLSEETWSSIRSHVLPEFDQFRQLSSANQTAYLEKVGRALDELFKSRFNVAQYGMHYNLHGGTGFQYVDGEGIRATRGDSMFYGMAGSMPMPVLPPDQWTVYFYLSNSGGVGEAIRRAIPARSSVGRGGEFLILFNANAVRELPGVTDHDSLNGRAFRFDNLSPNRVGVPTSHFVVPPLLVMTDVPERLGADRPLSDNEIRLASLRHLEALFRDERIQSLRFTPQTNAETRTTPAVTSGVR